MLSALSAESLKLRHHRGTWLLVWIFPLGAIVISAIAIIAQLAQGAPPTPGTSVSAWIANADNFWDLPRNGLGRYLIAAYVAIVFGGEYGWNTWKLIVPHRARSTLIAAKFVVGIGLLYLAFIAAALLVTGFVWLEDVVTGDAIPDGITAGAIAAAHLQGFAASLAPVLVTAAMTALAAVLTRSTTAALVIGIVLITGEQLFTTFAPMIAAFMPVEGLFAILPGYHVSNLTSWALDGTARIVPFPSGNMVAMDWTTSLGVVAAWVVGLVALTFWRFGRQDIN